MTARQVLAVMTIPEFVAWSLFYLDRADDDDDEADNEGEGATMGAAPIVKTSGGPVLDARKMTAAELTAALMPKRRR